LDASNLNTSSIKARLLWWCFDYFGINRMLIARRQNDFENISVKQMRGLPGMSMLYSHNPAAVLLETFAMYKTFLLCDTNVV
jgi:hypothetical protein